MHVLFVLLAMNVFFVRGNVLDAISVSWFIPVLTVALSGLIVVGLVVANIRIELGGTAYVILFSAIIINVLFASIFFSNPALSLRFGAEMVLNGGIFVVTLTLLRNRVISERFLLTVVPIAGIVLAANVLMTASSLEVVRRIGSDHPVASAANHAGHSLAIASIMACGLVVGFTGARSHKLGQVFSISLWIFLVVGTVLTGSRAGVFGLIAGLLIIGIWALRRRVSRRRFTLLSIVVLLIVTAFLSEDRYRSLVTRFTIARIVSSGEGRLRHVRGTLQEITSASELTVGQPWRYAPLGGPNPLDYPHNMLLGVLVHAGIIPAAAFAWILISRSTMMGAFALRRGVRVEAAVALGALFAGLAYILSSGRVTRVLTIFMILAIVEALLGKGGLRVVNSVKEEKRQQGLGKRYSPKRRL